MAEFMYNNTFFCARYLNSGTGEGLFESLERAVQYVGIEDWKTKMVGFRCDGASADITEGGLKGLLKRKVTWIFMFWFLAYHLELSVKHALKELPHMLYTRAPSYAEYLQQLFKHYGSLSTGM